MSVIKIVIYFSFIIQSKCAIDVFEHVKNTYGDKTQKMPTIHRNLLLLKEDCGEVCDTSDRFLKTPGKYFDVIKKEFECDILLENPSMYPHLVADEQMIKTGKNSYKPPSIYEVPQEIAELYTFEKRVRILPAHFYDQAKWIENSEYDWKIDDINTMINHLKKGLLKGAYGEEVSNEMAEILKTYMIDEVQGVKKNYITNVNCHKYYFANYFTDNRQTCFSYWQYSSMD